jgi:hypothetical protein
MHFDSRRIRYVKLTFAAYALWIACFELVGHVASQLPSRDLSTSIDRSIPLFPPAIWLYESCYLLPFAVPLLARDFRRVHIGFRAALIANATAFIVYLAYPVAFPRPKLGSSVAERLLALEYALDFQPGANNLPSLHVAMSFLTLLTCSRQGLPRGVMSALTLLALGITASTLLVKQHLVLDAALGVVWALASFKLAERWSQHIEARATSSEAVVRTTD